MDCFRQGLVDLPIQAVDRYRRKLLCFQVPLSRFQRGDASRRIAKREPPGQYLVEDYTQRENIRARVTARRTVTPLCSWTSRICSGGM